jgi:DNA-binding SARP family transcriptional activator
MLSLKLLGNVELSKNGELLHGFRSQKEPALLIYLAQTGQSHRRDFIAELLWDSGTTKQA